MSKRTKWIIISVVISYLLIVILAVTVLKQKTPEQISNPDGDSINMAHYVNDKETIYYFENKGNTLKKWDLAKSQTETIVKLKDIGVDWVEYSPNNTMALVHWTNPEDGIENKTWLVDLVNKKIVSEIQDSINDVFWRMDSKKIAYHNIDFNSDVNSLVVSNPDGSGRQEVAQLDEDYYQFYWTDENKLIYFPLPTESIETDLFELNINNGQTNTLVMQKYLGNNFKISNSVILFEMSLKGSEDYKLYRYDINNNEFIFLDNNVLAKPIASLDQEKLFIGLELKDGNKSLVKFTNFSKKKIRVSLDELNVITDLFYDDKTIYFVDNGKLFKVNYNIQ